MKSLIKIFMFTWLPLLMFWCAVGSPPFLTFKQLTVVAVVAALLVGSFFKVLLGRAYPLAPPTTYSPYQGPEIGDPNNMPIASNQPSEPSAPNTSQPPGCIPVEPRHSDD